MDLTEDGSQGLGGLEEFGRVDGIVLVGVDANVGERPLEGLDNGTAGRDDWS